MKTAIFLLCMLPLLVYSQVRDNPDGDLYVQVNGDTVYLGQGMAVRNCGATYTMTVVLTGDTLRWYQVDTGATALCLCKFDLSVSVDSMPAGHYTAKVYYTACPDCPPPAPDTVYVGSVEFDVTVPNSNTTVNTVSQHQSDCTPYTSTDEPWGPKPACTILPNPVQNTLRVVTSDPGVKEITIFDLQGRGIAHGIFETEIFDLDMAHCRSGLYILVYSNRLTTYHTRFIVE